MKKLEKKTTKIVSLAMLTVVLATPTIYTIAVSKKTYMGGIQNVTFFAQSPNFRDKGFNELTYDGASDYASFSKQEVGNQATAAYSPDGKGYVNEIANLYDQGVDTIVSSGFNVASTFSSSKKSGAEYDGLWERADKYKKKKIVIVDDDTLSNMNENAVSIKFKAEDAGFMAGIAASIYTTNLWTEKKGYKPSIAVWGGENYSTVYGWLSGFEQAVNWFDYQILGYDLSGNELCGNIVESFDFDELQDSSKTLGLAIKKHTDSSTSSLAKIFGMPKIKLNNAGEINDINYGLTIEDSSVNPNPTNAEEVSKSFYTGGFESDPNDGASGANAMTKIQNVNQNKDSIVFPVAGGQTTETLANLNKNSLTMAIGVDSDASLSTPNYAKNILGSATKNVRKAANYGSWYADKNIKSMDVSDILDPEHKNFAESNSEENEKGWLVPSEEKGSQFIGTKANGGVGFVETNNIVSNSLFSLLGKDITSKESCIIDDIFKFNENKIEAASNTFAIQGDYTPEHSTLNSDLPWIPDWATYKTKDAKN